MATGAAAVTVANSTSGIIVARSFRWLRKTAFTFRRAFNLDLPKTQVGSGTTWYLTRANKPSRNFCSGSQILRRSSRYYSQPGASEPGGEARSARIERRLEPHREHPTASRVGKGGGAVFGERPRRPPVRAWRAWVPERKLRRGPHTCRSRHSPRRRWGPEAHGTSGPLLPAVQSRRHTKAASTPDAVTYSPPRRSPAWEQR